MISHKHRCIFVHQAKSAGTSVKALLADEDMSEEDVRSLNDGLLSPDWDDLTARYPEYFKFTIVRNPYDRFISGWKYCHGTKRLTVAEVLDFLPRKELRAVFAAPGGSLKARSFYVYDFLRRYARHGLRQTLLRFGKLPGALRGHVDPNHDYWHVTLPQHAKIYREDGTLAVDRVYHFEDLPGAMTDLAQTLGLASADLPHVNAARGDVQRYQDCFTAETRAKFETVFAKELRLLPYDFETGQPVSVTGTSG